MPTYNEVGYTFNQAATLYGGVETPAFHLTHRFISLDGFTTLDVDGDSGAIPRSGDTYLLADYEGHAEVSGFYTTASGQIAKSLKDAFPAAFSYGATWKVFAPDEAEPVWSGQLVDSETNGGVVTLKAEGWGMKARKEFQRLLWQTRDESDWTVASADPFNWDDDDQIEARVRGRTLNWRVRRNSIFKKKAGAPSMWWTGVVFAAPTADINHFKANIVKPDGADSDYNLELCKAPFPNGTITVIATYSMGSGGPSTINEPISGAGTELIMLRLTRSTETKKSDNFRLILKDVRVGALAGSDQTYKVHQVVTDIATKVASGWDQSGIVTTTQNAMPADFEGVSAADVLDEMALLVDRVWGVTDKKWVFRDWGDHTWTLARSEIFPQQDPANWPAFPVELVPRDRYNVVMVPFRYGGGVRGEKRVTASPNPMPGGITQTQRIDLEDPLPSEEIATVFGQNIANYLSTEKFDGQATATQVKDGAVWVSAWRVKPGDKITLPDNGNRTLRVESITQTADRVYFHFAGGHPLLEKALKRRRLLLNRGRSNAGATLSGLGIKKPAAPTLPGTPLTFSLQIRKNNHRDYDAVCNWNVVTDDISSPTKTTAIQAYIVQFRAVDGSDVEIAAFDKKHKRITDKSDGDADDFIPTRCVFERVPHPRVYRYQFRVRAEDVLGRLSAWSGWSGSVLPINETPPVPTSVAIDVDRHKILVQWDSNKDPDDNDELDPRIHHFHYRLKNPLGNVIRAGTTRDYSEMWKIKKPGAGNYTIEVCSVDSNGAKSAYASATGNKLDPPTPAVAPVLTYSDGGKMKVTVEVTFTYGDPGYTDDDIERFAVFLVDNSRTRRLAVPVDESNFDDTHTVYFKNVRDGHAVEAYYRAIDSKGHRSPDSPHANGTAGDPKTAQAPATVTIQSRLRSALVLWAKPTTDSDEVDHYEVELLDGVTSAVVDSDRHAKGLRKAFPLAVGDTSTYNARVRSVLKGSGKVSGWVTTAAPVSRDKTYNSDYNPLSVTGGGATESIDDITITDYNIGSINADKIVAGTITGRKIQTGTSGARVVMLDSAGEADRIKFFNAAGSNAGEIWGDANTWLRTGVPFQMAALIVETFAGSNPPTGTARIWKEPSANNLKVKYPDGTVKTLAEV